MNHPASSARKNARDQRRGLLVLVGIFGVMALTSIGFPSRARMYPLFVGTLGALLASAELFVSARRAADEQERPSLWNSFQDIVPYLGWLVAYLVTVGLVGFVLGSACFVGLFLHREGKTSLTESSLGFVGVCVFLIVAGITFGLHWPASVIAPLRWLGLY